jgi:hypothetical protein
VALRLKFTVFSFYWLTKFRFQFFDVGQLAAELGAFFFAVACFFYTHFRNGEELVVVGDCNATLRPRRDRSGRVPETQTDKEEVLSGFINGLGVFDTA